MIGKTIAIILLIVGIIMFLIGATTGTVSGYQGANGLYYSTSAGSNEWMCLPGFIIAAIGGVILWATKKS